MTAEFSLSRRGINRLVWFCPRNELSHDNGDDHREFPWGGCRCQRWACAPCAGVQREGGAWRMIDSPSKLGVYYVGDLEASGSKASAICACLRSFLAYFLLTGCQNLFIKKGRRKRKEGHTPRIRSRRRSQQDRGECRAERWERSQGFRR